jgi:DNA-binding transcriptional MocR family regulator
MEGSDKSMSKLHLSIDAAIRPRYLGIVAAIEAALTQGGLRPGERFPTQRDLAQQLGMAIATISRAYEEAERRGLLTSHVGRGTFVASVPRGLKSPRAEAPPPGIVDLAMYRVQTPPLADIMHEAAQAAITGDRLLAMFDEHTPLGPAKYREGGAAWFERHGVRVAPSEVVVCNGGQHAMLVTLGVLAERGDVILTERLTDPSMKAVSVLLGRSLYPVDMDDGGLLPDALERACIDSKARVLYCTPTLHNPTTATLDRARREAIVAIARRHGIQIVESLLYGLHLPTAPSPLAMLAPERTYVITSLGRILGPGCKVGYVAGPPGSSERLAMGISMSMGMPSQISSEIATRMLVSGNIRQFVKWQKKEAAARAAIASAHLADFGPRCEPASTHAWLPLTPAWRSDEFVEKLAQSAVMTSYTHSFVVGRSAAPHAIRLCLGAPSNRSELASALATVASLLRSAPRYV